MTKGAFTTTGSLHWLVRMWYVRHATSEGLPPKRVFLFLAWEVTTDIRDPDTGRAVGKEKPEKPFAFEDTVFHVYHAWFRGRSWEDDLLLLSV